MKKIIQTKQQRENTLDALNVMWPSVPPENVVWRLSQWREGFETSPPTCGTIACFGGWCAWWPNFNRQGVSVLSDSCGAPSYLGQYDSEADVSSHLFGDDCMFAPRGCLDRDNGFAGTDHELVTHRLKWILENSEVTA